MQTIGCEDLDHREEEQDQTARALTNRDLGPPAALAGRPPSCGERRPSHP